jgi:hypothetical protein
MATTKSLQTTNIWFVEPWENYYRKKIDVLASRIKVNKVSIATQVSELSSCYI